MVYGPITSWQIDGGNSGNSDGGAPESLQMVSIAMKLKNVCSTWKQPRRPSADKWIRKLWYIYTMEYYSAIKKNSFESFLMRWLKLEPIIQSEVSQKDKDQYNILMHIYGILKDGNDNPICKTEKETQMYRTEFWTLWEKAREGYSERTALKQVYYQG